MLSFLLYTIICAKTHGTPSPYSCDDIEVEECQEIMMERYSLTVEDYNNMMPLHQAIMSDNLGCVREDKCPLHIPRIEGKTHKCDENGVVEGYPCSNVDLLSFIPLIELGSQYNASGNDIWGYTEYDDEDNAIGWYALTCQTDGASIVDITDPINPVVLAFIESNVEPIRHVNWRDLKVLDDYAYVVADTRGNYDDHGLQIFNIKYIIQKAKDHQQHHPDEIYKVIYDGIDGSDEVAIYNEFGGSHNLFVNEESRYLYSVGTSTCDGGLHVVDINDPMNPQYSGCFRHANESSYVHDAQCVNYHGPDERYTDHEICFAFTPRTYAFTIIDVDDKNNMNVLAQVEYEWAAYTHQGWVTNNHEFVLMNDEKDETTFNLTQMTYIWDIRDLENPFILNIYDSNLTVIDHNEYIVDNGKTGDNFHGFVFQSNYEAGVRILNIDDIANGNLYEIAYFDNYIWKDNINYTVSDDHNKPFYRGSWSVFPYFKSKRNSSKYVDLIVSQNINTGLYVLRHHLASNELFEPYDKVDDDEGFWSDEIIAIFISIGAVIVIIPIIFCLCKQCKKEKSDEDVAIETLLNDDNFTIK